MFWCKWLDKLDWYWKNYTIGCVVFITIVFLIMTIIAFIVIHIQDHHKIRSKAFIRGLKHGKSS